MLQKYVPFPPGNQAGIFIRAESGKSLCSWYTQSMDLDKGSLQDL